MLLLARTLGLDIMTLMELIDTSAGANAAMKALHRTITPEGAHHVDEMMLKDIGVFGRVMRELGGDPRAWRTGASVASAASPRASRSCPGPLHREPRGGEHADG